MLVCLNTCPDMQRARALARVLVDEQLAACVQIVPGVESVYRWQGRVEQAGECLLLIKTTPECWPALRGCIGQRHPYAVPELLALEVADGLPAYLDWVRSQTRAGAE